MSHSMKKMSASTNLEYAYDGSRDDQLKRILFPVLSPTLPPLRPSTTSASSRDITDYQNLFLQSCTQIQEQFTKHQWPFCPIYILHINTYCHIDYYAIPAEISLVETTFWPELYGSQNNVQSMNISKKINGHYERHSSFYKRFCSITDDFHDFVHPGDQLPTGYQADILEHSRRTHGLPCTPYDKIGTQEYNQLLDDLNEMLCSLCEDAQEAMPMFCTMESFWSTKAALDWIYDQPSTRHRTDDYTLYPIEALIAVIYENYYSRTAFQCDLRVLMGKTPQQPVLHSRACDYHAILENKHCAMAHVRDLSNYYISLMAYLFYTYCDQNSSTLLPYIKSAYDGNLSLQQEIYWSNKTGQYDKILSENPSKLPPLAHPDFHEKKSKPKPNCPLPRATDSDLNPLAIPFSNHRFHQPKTSHLPVKNNERTQAQLVLFEPREYSRQKPSCPTIYQRLHHRPRENWD